MNQLTEIVGLFLKAFDREFIALFLTLPRMYAFFAASSLLNPSAVPRTARTAVILTLAIIAIPINTPAVDGFDRSIPAFALLFAKEYIIGFLIGYMVGWVFWVVQSVGALIDNQRGAAIASSIDPLQGQETSVVGIMLSQVFLTYVFLSGAIFPIIGLIYQSYKIWPIASVLPELSPDFPAEVLLMADKALGMVVLLGGPIVAVMFLAEFSLAVISRFSPQVQVFVLAMPIKSILGIFMLILYFGVMMPFANNALLNSIGLVDRLAVMLRVPGSPMPEAIKPMYPIPLEQFEAERRRAAP